MNADIALGLPARRGALVAPAVGTIDVWHIQLSAWRPLWPQLLRFLDLGDRQRIDRFVHEARRVDGIVSAAVLRLILAACLDQPAGGIAINREPRPHLRTPADGIDFNVAHGSATMLVAVARNRPVGVDVEQARALGTAQSLASRFFSPAEAAWVGTGSGGEQSARFLRLWTLKEAALKVDGRGLREGLRTPSVLDATAAAAWTPVQLADGKQLIVRELPIGPAAFGAVATDVQAEPALRAIAGHPEPDRLTPG